MVVPPALQRVCIEVDHAIMPSNNTVVHTSDTDHSPFISATKELAAILAISSS